VSLSIERPAARALRTLLAGLVLSLVGVLLAGSPLRAATDAQALAGEESRPAAAKKSRTNGLYTRQIKVANCNANRPVMARQRK